MAPRCSPVSGSPSGSLRGLTLVVAMTAGCRAVLLAATAFWLAGRRLLKACIYRDGVLVFRQEGTSDRPLPVSISGADRVSVADRDGSCVTEFQEWRRQRRRLLPVMRLRYDDLYLPTGFNRRWRAARSR